MIVDAKNYKGGDARERSVKGAIIDFISGVGEGEEKTIEKLINALGKEVDLEYNARMHISKWCRKAGISYTTTLSDKGLTFYNLGR